MRRRSKLYTRMKRTGKAQDINTYKHFKSQFQKLESQSYFSYVNNIIEVEESEKDRQPKQKQFWSFTKSLRKDNSGISPLKDKGRLFNAARDNANILNNQYNYVSVYS